MISIILPVMNETHLSAKVSELIPYLKGREYELIIVDDSPPDQFQLLTKEFESYPKTMVIRGEGRGKGAAIKLGVGEAKGDIIFYIDADFRIPLENIEVFIQQIERQGYDCVIAQRPLDKTPRILPRRICSACFSAIVQLFVFHSFFIYDTQCGFKAFRSSILKKFAHKQTVGSGVFDVEYLYMARCNKLKICRISLVPMPEIRASRINVGKVIRYEVFDLLRIKLKGVRGFYKMEVAQK